MIVVIVLGVPPAYDRVTVMLTAAPATSPAVRMR
jgi:hypothetical protein